MPNRVRILLAAWCVAILAAGVLTYTINAASRSFNGWIALTWTVGYLVQFGLMMAILNVTERNTRFTPWFVASLLPWAIDWTMPSHLWLLAVWVPVVIGYAYWLDRSHDHTERLMRTGVRGTATVLTIMHRQFQTVVNNAFIRRKLRLSVRTEDGRTFETTMTGTFALGSEPDPGDTFAVRVDPAHPRRIVVDDHRMDDQRLTAKGVRAGGVVRAVHTRHARGGMVPCRLDLAVTQDGTGLQYDAHLAASFPAERLPTVGDKLSLIADPDDYTRVVLATEAEPTAF